MPGVTINKFTIIGKQCILNTACTIDHESTIGNGVHIMGSAAIAGRIHINDWATIGTNATILPDLKIEANTYVGAGSVVTKDTKEHSVVAGIPAKYIRKNNLDFQSEILVKMWGQLS
jgi:acetyltransferase-like isoleucine patch superfamily enzyme